MPIVETLALTKDYDVGAIFKKKHRAVDHLTLAIEQGEIFGLIGPNGAGKTTTLKLLMNLIFPTEGEARILGRPVSDVGMRAEIGYLPENPYFYDYLTGRELLEYFGQLFEIPSTERRLRVGELLDRVGLEASAEMQLRKYSKGMLQRLGIAQALLNRPKVVFLDEPMSGLDPMGRRDMTLLIHELRDQGTTVLFSSHILPDVEALCDQVAILNRGRLVRKGRLGEILDVSVRAVVLEVDHLSEELQKRLEPSASRLRKAGDRLRFEFPDRDAADKALEIIRSNGARVVSMTPVKQTLEEYFVHEVGAREQVEGS